MSKAATRRSPVPMIIAVLVVAAALGAGAFVLLQNTRALPAFIQPLVGRRFVHIQGDAMAPTLRAGQIVSVYALIYVHHSPQREDILLFPAPSDISRVFIKRIIVIPAD